MKLKRYPDRCYAVVSGNRRGPCGHDKPTAIKRFGKSGFIAFAGTDKPVVRRVPRVRITPAEHILQTAHL